MIIGDKVRIREWDDMVEEYGVSFCDAITIPDEDVFTDTMKKYCGTTHTVTKENYHKLKKGFFLDGYVITDGMVNIVIDEEDEYDPVSKPSHYCEGGNMECIDEMELVFGPKYVMAFCLLNAWKYRRRAMYKNGQQDMDKAAWYLDKYKELKEKTDEH